MKNDTVQIEWEYLKNTLRPNIRTEIMAAVQTSLFEYSAQMVRTKIEHEM